MNAALTFPSIFPHSREREDDDALLVRCRAGERAAFDILLERYRERVLNLAFQLLREPHAAEDVAQEVFVRAFSNIGQFRGEAALFTWLYQITLNQCRARTRRAKDTVSFDDCEEAAQLPTSHSTENAAVYGIALERALDRLSPPLRIALLLRELHGLSYEEIARVLKLPVGTVRSRLHAARRQFQEIWDEA